MPTDVGNIPMDKAWSGFSSFFAKHNAILWPSLFQQVLHGTSVWAFQVWIIMFVPEQLNNLVKKHTVCYVTKLSKGPHYSQENNSTYEWTGLSGNTYLDTVIVLGFPTVVPLLSCYLPQRLSLYQRHMSPPSICLMKKTRTFRRNSSILPQPAVLETCQQRDHSVSPYYTTSGSKLRTWLQ